MSSIYRPKHSVITPEADVCHSAHNTEAGAHPPQRGMSDDQSGWAALRKAQPMNVLLPATRRWLDSLPIENRPRALAEQFPRLANVIAADWNSPKDFSALISSLVQDRRGGRRGFPDDVLQNIFDLRVYYARLHPIVDWVGEADTDRHRQHWNHSTLRR